MKKTLISLLLAFVLVLCVGLLTAPEAKAADTDPILYHCLCGNKHSTALTDGQITWKEGTTQCYTGCDGVILEWAKWGATSTTTGGNFYLTANATTKRGLTSDVTLNIDMNGYDWAITTAARACEMSQGTVTICNTRTTGGSISGYGRSDSKNGATLNQFGGTLTLYGIDISVNNGGNSAASGGAVYVSAATFNMVGGSITGCPVTGNGGALYVHTSAKVNLTDVDITGGAATAGGAICTAGQLSITGGSITGANTTSVGTAMYIINGAVTMKDVAVTGATAAGNGGTICQGAGSLTVTGGSITGGTSSGEGKRGGNLFVGTNLITTLTGVTLENGTSVNAEGGNIYTSVGSTVTLDNCTVTGGTSLSHGGNIAAMGTLTVTGGTIADGIVTGSYSTVSGDVTTIYGNNGGNVFIGTDGTASLTGTTVTGGSAAGNGGNICLIQNNTGTLYLESCVIGNGTAGTLTTYSNRNGGNLWIGPASSTIDANSEKLVKIVRCTIYGGNALNGGSMMVARRVAMNSSTIGTDPEGKGAGGVSEDRGGNVFISDAELVMNGTSVITRGNSGSANGGNVFIGGVDGTGKLTINNTSSVEYGDAAQGGNIYLQKGSVYMGTNAKVSAGVANGSDTKEASGGNAYVENGTFTMAGNAVIAGGGYNGIYADPTPVTEYGANVYLAGGTLTMSGNSEVRNGVQKGSAQSGNFYIKGGQLTIGNNAQVYGGKVSANNRNIHLISGGLELSGSAKVDGGVVVQAGTVKLTGTPTLANYKVDDEGNTKTQRVLYLAKNIVVDMTGLTAGANIQINDSYTTAGDRQIATATAQQAAILDWVTLTENTENDNTKSFTLTREKDGEGNVSLWLRQADPVALGVAGDTYSYQTLEAAVAAYAAGEVITLKQPLDGTQIAQSVILDLNGNSLTNVTIPEGVTLYGMDSATDRYTCDTCGSVSGTINGNVERHIKTTSAQTGNIKRYLAINEEGVYSFHRFYLGVTHTTVRPATTGVGYKAVFYADDAVLNELADSATFGYTLSLAGGRSATVSKDKSDFVSGKTVTLRVDNYDVASFGEADLTAGVFLTLKEGAVIESTTVSYSMRDILEAVNAQIANLNQAQIEAIQAMCAKFTEAMANWNIQDILNWKHEETE